MTNAAAGPSSPSGSTTSFSTSPTMNWNSLASTSTYYDTMHPGGALGMNMQSQIGMDKTDEMDVVPLRANRQLCVRHKQMANQDVNQKLQRSLDNLSTAERSDITHLWSTFSGAAHAKRKIILEGILTMCCFSQLSHLSDSLNRIIRIDPFSLLPREVNLRILGYLDAFSLGRAAQVSKSWKALADDDLLWRRMCGQHIDRKCEKCGWGLPLLERRRLKVELNEGSPAVAVSIGGHEEGHAHGHSHSHSHSHSHASGHVHADDEQEDDHAHHHTGPLHVVSREEALGTARDSSGDAFALALAAAAAAGSSAGAGTSQLHGEGVCGPGAAVNELKRHGSNDQGSRKRVRVEDSREGVRITGKVKGKGKDRDTSSEGGKSEDREEKDGSPAPALVRQREGASTRASSKAKAGGSVQARMTKPWKSVYCERLVVERNWRKGRCKTTTLKGHEDGVMCLQYHTALSSPSHPVLITGSYDKTVRIWNLDTGECIRTLRGHTRAVRALQFDQRLLFTGSMDGTVRMWNWRAGECLRVLEGHTDGVVALHYNGQLLASGSADSTVNIWNFRNGTKFTLRGHEERVNAVLLWDGKSSPGDLDPTMMPTFTGKRGVSPHRSADINSNTSLSPVASTSTSYATGNSSSNSSSNGEAQVAPGMMLFSASDDHTIKLWDLTTRKCIRTFSGHRAHVQSVKVLMVDMTEAEIKARKRLRSVTPPVDPLAPMGYSAFAAASSANLPPLLGNAAVAANMADMLVDVPEGFDPHAHRSSRGKEVQPRVFLHDTGAGSHSHAQVSLTPDVEMHEADLLSSASASASAIGAGPSSSDKEDKEQKRAVLVSASLDGTVKVWDVDAGCETGTLFGHIEGVWGVDADALRIASASHDRTVKVWDRDAGTCVQTLVGHRGAVTALQLSDDMIVSGSDDGDVMVWSFAPNAISAAAPVQVSSPTPAPMLSLTAGPLPNGVNPNATASVATTGAAAPGVGNASNGGSGNGNVNGTIGVVGAPQLVRAPNLLRGG